MTASYCFCEGAIRSEIFTEELLVLWLFGLCLCKCCLNPIKQLSAIIPHGVFYVANDIVVGGWTIQTMNVFMCKCVCSPLVISHVIHCKIFGKAISPSSVHITHHTLIMNVIFCLTLIYESMSRHT